MPETSALCAHSWPHLEVYTLELQGLDYVVATACSSNIRLVLTLTNYLTAYGGMQTWVEWFQGENISDFYKSQNIRLASVAALSTFTLRGNNT